LSRFIRLLKSQKEKDSQEDEELQMKCSRCGERPATDPDGLCNQCRFEDVLTQMTEKK